MSGAGRGGDRGGDRGGGDRGGDRGGGARGGDGLSMDFPVQADEKQKCSTFLRDYTLGSFSKYMDQLQEIKNRQRRVLEIHCDDILDHRNDDDFVQNITRNTLRYLRYFEEAADEILDSLAETVRRQENDVFDILQNQREAANRNNNGDSQSGTAPRGDMPRSLTRRYEVVIIPSSGEKARKIREIKASDIGRLVKLRGMVTRSSDVKPHMSVCTYTCDVCGSEIYQEVVGISFTPILQCVAQRCVDNKSKGNVHPQSRGCKLVKYQELRMQELPDQVPVGHIPRAITVHCKGEQVLHVIHTYLLLHH